MLEKGGMTAASETGRRALEVGTGRRVSPPTCPTAPPEETGACAPLPEGTLEGGRDALNS